MITKFQFDLKLKVSSVSRLLRLIVIRSVLSAGSNEKSLDVGTAKLLVRSRTINISPAPLLTDIPMEPGLLELVLLLVIASVSDSVDED